METRYRIYAQQFSRELNKTLLIIEQQGKTEKLRKTADEIFSSETILKGLNVQDSFLVGYIVGIERENNNFN